MLKKPDIVIYTDGSCNPNPGVGGWAAIIQYKDNDKIRELYATGSEMVSTNNRMELMAVYKALAIIPDPSDIIIYADSKYVVEGLGTWEHGQPRKKGWIVNWKKQGWKKKYDEPIMNLDIWLNVYEEVQRHTKVAPRFIKGHSGNVFNEKCDLLAMMARQDAETDFTREQYE